MNAEMFGETDRQAISRKLRVLRWIQDLYLEADAYWQLSEIFQMILRSLDDLLGFKHSMIYLLNDDGETLSFQSGWGYSESHQGPVVKVGQGFIGVTARSGKVLRMGDLGKGFRYMNAIQPKNGILASTNCSVQFPGLISLESLMVVPLKAKSGIIGVISVESRIPGAFDDIDQELLLLIAGQTARFIDEVRREDENHRHQEGLLIAKAHLDQLNGYLDAVVTAADMKDSKTYAAALSLEMKGLRFSNRETKKAYSYFEQAADIFHEIGMGLEMARNKFGAAVLLLHEDSILAVNMLEECLGRFKACGAVGYAERIQDMLGQLQGQNNKFQLLTKREREITLLAAGGLSNAEIADQLYISIRTVTTHLERIYSKLEINSRSSLSKYINK